MEVNIYCLYDPITCRIRYIGRTKRDVKKRLNEHISNARRRGKNRYLYTWIRSLLKVGIRPGVKKLTVVSGWKESHEFERNLINKYRYKCDLVNMDDRGEGGLNKTFSKKTKEKQIQSLKKYYSKEENKKNFYNPIYCYDSQGNFYKKYKSSIFACKELNIKSSALANHINRFDNYNSKVNSLNGFYFSKFKVEKYPVCDKYQSNHQIVKVYKEDMLYKKFNTITSFMRYFNLGSWDISQIRKGIKTKRYKQLEKQYVIIAPFSSNAIRKSGELLENP